MHVEAAFRYIPTLNDWEVKKIKMEKLIKKLSMTNPAERREYKRNKPDEYRE